MKVTGWSKTNGTKSKSCLLQQLTKWKKKKKKKREQWPPVSAIQIKSGSVKLSAKPSCIPPTLSSVMDVWVYWEGTRKGVCEKKSGSSGTHLGSQGPVVTTGHHHYQQSRKLFLRSFRWGRPAYRSVGLALTVTSTVAAPVEMKHQTPMKVQYSHDD